MSFVKAKNQVIKIIEDVVPTLENAVNSSSFRYNSQLNNEDFKPQSRQFYYTVDALGTAPQTCPRIRRQLSLEINIFYREIRDRNTLNDVIMTDYENISDALMNPNLWDRANSKIVDLAVEDDFIMNASIDYDHEEGAFLVFEFPLLYSKNTK